jgi:outer membrane protein OmpA-like peptidoglycan-associated protein
MRWQHGCVAAALALAATHVSPAQRAHGATYRVEALTFGGGQISFSNGAIGFSDGRIGFGAGALSFQSGPVRTETGATIEITLPADILFDFDKAEIRPDARAPLLEVAQLVRERARGPALIQGYTDGLGVDAYNQKLSERRAAAVKAWLATSGGLASTPFTTSGFGARNPVAPNRNVDGSDNPEGRQLNRRVTLIIRR